MRRRGVAMCALRVVPFAFGLAFLAQTTPSSAVKPPPPASLPPLPMLPSVARVSVAKLGDALVLVTDVNLPRGDWSNQPLHFHVAFGAPGAPRAIDARLVAVADGSLEAEEDAVGEPLAVERVARRPPSAYPLLGREQMAGVVVTIPASAMTTALASGNMATLRVRTLIDAGAPDRDGAYGLVVRLGSSRGTPLTLGRVTAGNKQRGGGALRAEAHLCGPDADLHPLAVHSVPGEAKRSPNESGSDRPREPLIAPILSVRHSTDDLCVRLWPAKD